MTSVNIPYFSPGRARAWKSVEPSYRQEQRRRCRERQRGDDRISRAANNGAQDYTLRTAAAYKERAAGKAAHDLAII